jgi:regulatory protein YycI of two-component signal transduction system YycFG
MIMLHQDIVDGKQDLIQLTKIDKRSRKIYLTTNRGELKIYNVNSGVILEDIDTKAQIFKGYEQR